MPCQLSEQCSNNGNCVDDYLGGFTCVCKSGYTGKTCETGI